MTVSLSGVLLVLLAAVLHAVWNILAKQIRGDGALFVWWYGLISAVVFVPLGLLSPGAVESWDWPLLGAAAVSGLLHTAYGLILQVGYERAPLSVVYPVARGTGPLITMVVAIVLLGEQLSGTAALGAAAVLAGVAVVATFGHPAPAADDDAASLADTAGLPEASSPARPAPRPGALAGVLWGSAVGACIAAYTLWDDHSVARLDLPPLMYFALTSVFLVLSLTPAALRRRSEVRRSWTLDRSRIIAVGMLSPLAYVLVLVVMQSTPVALVAPLRESSIVVGSLLAWWLYREKGLVPRLVGCAAVLAGIALISV